MGERVELCKKRVAIYIDSEHPLGECITGAGVLGQHPMKYLGGRGMTCF